MRIISDYPLKNFNSFGISAKAAYFMQYTCEQDIELLLFNPVLKGKPIIIIGGGSNILFTKYFDGCVVHVNNKGIRLIGEEDDYVLIEAAAGEDWDSLISYCIDNNFGGLENLSGIPGKVGSSPIQNIGAYGVEVKDSLYEVQFFDLNTGSKIILKADECLLGYRDSIFKHQYNGKALIDKVIFKLSKKPVFNLSYKGVAEEVNRISPAEINIKVVSEAIKNIRRSKIPETKEIGSAGSFFKNPVIDKVKFDQLHAKYPDISFNTVDDNHYKLAAAWLIEKCGWKGYRKGDAGVHENQALILINYGNASGDEILRLATKIQSSVNEMFGLKLEMEVCIV